MNQNIIFVDIDGTLIWRSLEQWLLVYMRQEKLINPLKIIHDSFAYLRRWPFPKWYTWKLIYLQNQLEDEVDAWISDCWKRYIKSAIIPESIQILETFRNQGIRIVLLSGTFRALAKPLMSHLGIDDIICAEPIIDQRRYTGALQNPHPRGIHKVHYVDEWLVSHKFTWDFTIGMADHWHDRHLLFKVSVPIAVHPKPKLLKLANQNQWLVLSQPSEVENINRIVIEKIHLTN